MKKVLEAFEKVGEIENAILDGIIANTQADALSYMFKIKDKYL